MAGRKIQKIEPYINRSCLYHTQDMAAMIASRMMASEYGLTLYPESFIRIASHPLDHRASWMSRYDNRVLHFYTVPPILEKEPLGLEDSRLWC
jgi:hypothetical protein